MNRKFDLGPVLVALGATVLLVSLFVRWFDPGGTAWQVFEIVDLLLCGLALAALASAAGRLGSDARATGAVALLALVVVAVQLIDAPPAARGSEIATGGWMALAGTAAMVVGAALTLASFSVVIDVRGREARRRVAAVDRRTDVEDEVAPVVDRPPVPDEPHQRTQPFAALSPDDPEREET